MLILFQNILWLIDGTFVYQFHEAGLLSKAKGQIHKVPATTAEALKSDLMGMFEKNRCKKFFQFIQDYEVNNPKTQEGCDPNGKFKDVIKKFGLESNTVDFVGHAVALYTNDDGLAEGFSRLCALYGGTYMLNRDIEEILYDENGNFRGIKSQGEEAYGKILITEPSYVQKWNKVKSVGKVIRRICILDHPIPKTNDVASCQIILPQKQIKRKNDIFIAVINYTHCVCKKGYYLAIVSTMAETDDPIKEIQPAMDCLGPVLETFDKVSDIYQPVDPTFKGNVYITSSFDPQSHFENDTDNVIDIYEKITGAKLDLNLEEEGENKQ